MLKGLTRAGIGNVGDVDLFVKKAAKYGFETVDTSGQDVLQFIESKGTDGAKAYLEQHRIKVGAINLSTQWRTSEEEFRSGLDRLAEEAKSAASIGCRTCNTYIVPSTDELPARFMAVAIRRLRICAQIVGAFGMSLGLEFVGPHHLRTHWKHPFIWTAEDVLEMASAIGESNVGLLLDSFHWHTAEMTVDDLLSLRSDQITHVHINDAPDVPITEMLDNDRLYPGEGVIDLEGFLKALHRIGYNGVVSQEILLPQPPSDSSDTLLARSQIGFEKVWGKAGLLSV